MSYDTIGVMSNVLVTPAITLSLPSTYKAVSDA